MISNNLRIVLILLGLALMVFVFMLVKKDRIPIRYSLFWFVCSFIIILVGVMPNVISKFTRLVGFEATSSLVIGLILSMLLVITLMLTLIIADHNRKIVILTQELSTIKSQKNK